MSLIHRLTVVLRIRIGECLGRKTRTKSELRHVRNGDTLETRTIRRVRGQEMEEVRKI